MASLSWSTMWGPAVTEAILASTLDVRTEHGNALALHPPNILAFPTTQATTMPGDYDIPRPSKINL